MNIISNTGIQDDYIALINCCEAMMYKGIVTDASWMVKLGFYIVLKR